MPRGERLGYRGAAARVASQETSATSAAAIAKLGARADKRPTMFGALGAVSARWPTLAAPVASLFSPRMPPIELYTLSRRVERCPRGTGAP